MSSSLTFVVGQNTSFSLHFAPTTPLVQVLAKACEEKGLDPATHALRCNKKLLDLSVPLRLANIPLGTKLEIVKTSAKGAEITVALQLPDNQRFVQNCSSNGTLWDILCQFEKACNLNLTRVVVEPEKASALVAIFQKPKSDQRALYQQPVVSYMNKPYQSLSDLVSTTLKSLGIMSGSVILKLFFKETNETIEEHDQMLTALRASLSTPSPTPTPTPTPEQVQSQQQQPEQLHQASQHSSPWNDPNIANLQPFKGGFSFSNAPAPTTSTTSAPPTNTPSSSSPTTSPTTSPALATSTTTAATPAIVNQDSRISMPPPSSTPTSAAYAAFISASTSTPTSTASSSSSAAAWSGNSRLLSLSNVKFKAPPRELRLFSAAEGATDPRQFDLPDDFFRVTEGDVRDMLVSLQERRKREEGAKMLKTQAMRESEEIEKALQYKICTVRVVLPDRMFLQAHFHPLEPISAVHAVVDSALAPPVQPHYLFITPPVKRLSCDASPLFRLGFVPTAVVYLKFENPTATSSPVASLLATLAPLPAPTPIIYHPPSTASPSTSAAVNDTVNSDTMEVDAPASSGATEVTSKRPKWFKS